MPELKHCELFGGIGGFSLAAEQIEYNGNYIKTTDYCDIDEDAIAVYSDNFPETRIHRDIRNYFPQQGEFDLITCGFPCTGTSNAGTRTGLAHPESALWREGLRILCQTQPRYFIWEQPVGIADRGLRAILGATRMAGYKTEIGVVSAGSCGAAHNRERLFTIAYPDGQRWRQEPEQWVKQIRTEVKKTWANSQWLKVKPRGDGSVDGVSCVVVEGDRTLYEFNPTCKPRTKGRLKARILLGKSVTPAQAEIVLRRVLYLEGCKETRPA